MNYHFNQNQKEPESATKLKNEQAYAKEELRKEEQKNVLRGHCYESYCHIGKKGEVWDPEAYAFLNYRNGKEKAGIISPELRVRAQFYKINGLFEVLAGRIYQIRGYDSANLTLIRTTESKMEQYGWVVINCLHSRECTYEALKLADAYFRQTKDGEDKDVYSLMGNIKAIILTEPDESCYGGVKAVLYYNQGCKSKAEEATCQLKEDITILSGEQFLSTCMKDLVYGGNVKARKESMANGFLLEASENGKVMTGIGQGASNGTKGFLRPTSMFGRSCECFVRGLRLQFQMSAALPGAYHLYFPDYDALWMSHWELTYYQLNGTFRPEWERIWEYYMEAYQLFKDAKVLLQVNGWPHWNEGEEEDNETSLQTYIRKRACLYKYWHDRTLFYANMGYTAEETAMRVGMPKTLENYFFIHQTKEERLMYVKAVYNIHFGWYDGNPIHFARLGRLQRANNFMKYVREDSLETALTEYQNGNYQEVAEILEMALLVEPGNEKVRYLLADCLEQLGYQASYGALRNAYLSSAYELRNPGAAGKLGVEKENKELLSLLTPKMFLEKLSIAYDERQEEELKAFCFDIKFSLEAVECYQVMVGNGCFMFKKEEREPVIQVLEIDRKQMYLIISNLGRKKYLQEILPVTENKELNRNIWKLFSCMVNLTEYRGFATIEENVRGIVVSCKNMLLSYYQQVKRADKKNKFTFSDEDMALWQEEYYKKLVKGSYMEIQSFTGICEEGIFQKYNYFLFLYQCYRYLARYCRDTEENRNVIKCIQILEPYMGRFEGEASDSERSIFLNIFDYHQVMEDVKKIEKNGLYLRSDGKITACELAEFLMEGYRFLFDN